MGRTDPELLRLVQEFVKPGQAVWDVGANVGLFTFAAAALAGRTGTVLALEPDLFLVDLLRRSAKIQPDPSAAVKILPVAAAAEVEIRRFQIAARSSAMNALKGYGSGQMGKVREEHFVPTVSLDWLAQRFPPPDILKVDVEGAEFEVLEGAAQLIRTARPVILCEVSAETSARVTEFLQKNSYKIYDGALDPANRQELRSAPWNTIAMPD